VVVDLLGQIHGESVRVGVAQFVLRLDAVAEMRCADLIVCECLVASAAVPVRYETARFAVAAGDLVVAVAVVGIGWFAPAVVGLAVGQFSVVLVAIARIPLVGRRIEAVSCRVVAGKIAVVGGLWPRMNQVFVDRRLSQMSSSGYGCLLDRDVANDNADV
jgi:hypothetical protein